jgi:hypothetical protein
MKARLSIHLPLILLSIVVCIGLASLLSTAEAVTMLGGADLDKYCHSIGGEKVTLKGANGYSWHCTKANGQELPLSVLQACKVTYNDNDAIDLLENYFNPYSWKCFTDAKQLRSVDLNGYCKSQGHKGLIVSGSTAYSLYCQTNSGQRVGISVTNACQWTWGNSNVIARMGNFNDPNSWQCWGDK